MAKQNKTKDKLKDIQETKKDDFAEELIRQLNKEHNEKIAFNLGTDDAPTNIKRWISTGSKQLDCIVSNRLNGGLPEGRIVEIYGGASCHAAGDKVVLSNGRTKNVEDVKKGDKLLGPDGGIRTVLETHTGNDQRMYKLKPSRGGKTYTVTENHILSLKRVMGTTKNDYGPKSKTNHVVNIPVKDYLASSKTFKRKYKQQRVSVKEFHGRKAQELPIPPYILGLLLGDGSLGEKRIELTTADNEIQEAYCNYLQSIGYGYSLHHKKDCKARGVYHKSSLRPAGKFTVENPDKDIVRCILRDLGLLGKTSGSKFVPDAYKFSSVENRRQLIAGLIDTDGHKSGRNNYDYVTKSKQLAIDLAFICSSVGYRAKPSEKVARYRNLTNTYYRVSISGDMSSLPVRLERKKAELSTHRRLDNQSLTGFSLKEVPKERYYGFTVDKDNLYLTDDFSVFHNSGKSHICFEAAKSTQAHGGIVVYIDTENATSMENLRNMGIDVSHKFVFVQTACTEDIFKVAESTINRARAMTKDVPVTIIWDSVAASSPKAELTGEYDKDSIGLQARAIGKGMRKISNIIGSQKVLFLLVNQTRKNIGVMFGDDEITPGGRSIPYAASTRIKITSSGQKQIQDKKGRTVGIKVKAKTIKNKVARPFRECEFQIHFGQGVVEHEELFDLFREYCSTAKSGGVVVGNEVVSVSGTGAWKSFSVIDKETGEVKNEVKFHKPDFAEKVLDLPENKEYFDALLDAALVIKHGVKDHPTYVGINYSDTEEVKSIQALQKEQAK